MEKTTPVFVTCWKHQQEKRALGNSNESVAPPVLPTDSAQCATVLSLLSSDFPVLEWHRLSCPFNTEGFKK